jgi:hypothetical protein
MQALGLLLGFLSDLRSTPAVRERRRARPNAGPARPRAFCSRARAPLPAAPAPAPSPRLDSGTATRRRSLAFDPSLASLQAISTSGTPTSTPRAPSRSDSRHHRSERSMKESGPTSTIQRTEDRDWVPMMVVRSRRRGTAALPLATVELRKDRVARAGHRKRAVEVLYAWASTWVLDSDPSPLGQLQNLRELRLREPSRLQGARRRSRVGTL